VLKDSTRRGSAYLEIVERHPGAEAELLGAFEADGSREVALRRFLISLRVPPFLLVGVGRFVPGEDQRAFLHHAIHQYAFWLSVRRAVDGEHWRRLTRATRSGTIPP
jgi:hypothetical protein